MNNFHVGGNWIQFSRRRRVLMDVSPVRYFTLLSASRWPRSTSLENTKRQPCRSERSEFTALLVPAPLGSTIRLSMLTWVEYSFSPSALLIVLNSVLFPLSP